MRIFRSIKSIKLLIVVFFVACGGNDGPLLTDPDANGANQFLNFRSSRLDIESGQPIAKSALVDVRIASMSEWCTGGCGDDAQCSPRGLEILEVESGDPEALEVVAVEGGPLDDDQPDATVTLRGAGVGSATLRVRGLVSNGSEGAVEVEDVYTFEVAEADRFEFCPSRLCPDSGDFVFLADRGIQMNWNYLRAGQALGGEGYYPIEVDPPDGAVFDFDSNPFGFEVIGAASEAPVKLRSTVGDHVYAMRFIDERQIDQLPLQRRTTSGGWRDELLGDGDVAEFPSDSILSLNVRPHYAGTKVYDAEVDLRVETTDAARCRFYTYRVDFEDLPTQEDLLPTVHGFDLVTRGPGTCTLTVTHLLPDGTAGAQSTVDLHLVDVDEN